MSTNNRRAREIKEANSLRYENPNEVDNYIQEPYHALRVSVGVDLLLKKIKEIKVAKGNDNLVRILELASSSGRVAKRIKESVDCQLIASDIELGPLSLADKKLLDLIQIDATENIPLKTQSLDGIFMGELIEHIFDPMYTLSECQRVLRSDGLLLITTPNLAGLQDRISFLFGISPRHVNPLHEYLYLHIRPFTFEMLSLVLKKSGFNVLAVHSNYVRIRFSSGKHIDSRLLAKIFPTLGGSLVVLAQKSRN